MLAFLAIPNAAPDGGWLPLERLNSYALWRLLGLPNGSPAHFWVRGEGDPKLVSWSPKMAPRTVVRLGVENGWIPQPAEWKPCPDPGDAVVALGLR